MIKSLITLLILSATNFLAHAESIPVLVVGVKSYTNAEIIHVTPVTVTLRTDGGIYSVPMSNMPAAFKAAHNYSPESAAKFVADRKEAQKILAAKDAAARALTLQRMEEEQKRDEQASMLRHWDSLANSALNPDDPIYLKPAFAKLSERNRRIQWQKENRVYLTRSDELAVQAEKEQIDAELLQAERRRTEILEGLNQAIPWFKEKLEGGNERAREPLARYESAKQTLSAWITAAREAQEREEIRIARAKVVAAQQEIADNTREANRKLDAIKSEQEDQASKLRQLQWDADKAKRR